MSGVSRPEVLLVASENPGKVAEIRRLLAAVPLQVISLADLPSPPQLTEPHDTFAGNAQHKAATAARASDYLAVADDSGLVVPALDGAPGIRSSRVADSDPGRIRWLLEEMKDLTGEQRAAYFVCVIALANLHGEMLGTWRGRVDGIIIPQPQGEGGFGYDPVFLYPPTQQTFAQMTAGLKNDVSHRGQALRDFARDLPAIINDIASDN